MYLSRATQYIFLLLRLSLGWMFIFDGYTKFTDKAWSILPAIQGSNIAPKLYNMLTTGPILSMINQWYPLLLIIAGAMIFTGLWMRTGATLTVILLLFTYLPQLKFPVTSSTVHIIDFHIIYMLLVLALAWMNADQFWGLGADITINK